MIQALRDPQTRDKYLSLLRKQFVQYLRRPRACKPVFVLGKQRSGTSMLMFAFHRHPGALVFDEHRDSRVFKDFRIRGFEVVREAIADSRFPIACFKPICDSHLIEEFVRQFPDAHYIWIYRHYQDVANSALRQAAAPTRAVRLVCTGQPGGGWFDEGVSAETRRILMDVYKPELSDFDLSCLVWWARNRIIVESGLLPSPDITLVKYEELVLAPKPMLRWLFTRMGPAFDDRIGARMTPRSISRHPAPVMNETVQRLCADLMRNLDQAYLACSPPSNRACQS
jgi:hypothetical protein